MDDGVLYEMNQKMRDIVADCMIMNPSNMTLPADRFDYGKFASQIIQECANIAFEYSLSERTRIAILDLLKDDSERV